MRGARSPDGRAPPLTPKNPTINPDPTEGRKHDDKQRNGGGARRDGPERRAVAAKREGAVPTVSGIGPGEWNDPLVAGIAQVCAGRDLGDNGALASPP